MIPNDDSYEEELENDFFVESEPSLTYAMKMSNEIEKNSAYVGKVDDVEAIRQAVMKILNTERYEHEIHSWNYGIEIQDLFGMDMPYVMSEVKRRITDALVVDDRIESVEDFEIEIIGRHTLHCNFTVVTAQGEEIEEETEVEV